MIAFWRITPELERLHGRLGEETGSSLRRILSARSAGPKPGRATSSKAKVLEKWENAWGDWSSCVFESGEEEGNYVYQEHHWEPPCLDTSALADDLEPFAARMKKLLKRIGSQMSWS